MALNTVQATLTAFANRLQEAEDATFTVLDPLSDPTLESISGDLLDKIGARVGELRGGRLDEDYRAAIRIRVRVNRSRGKAEDVIAVAVLASINSTPVYSEFGATVPATFQVDCEDLPGAATVAKLLGKTKAAGTLGILAYTVDASDGFTFGDATDATNTVTNEQFADSVSLTGPGFASGVMLSPM